MEAGKLFAQPIPDARVAWEPRDAILYALGTGLGGHCDEIPGRDVLRFLYEKDLEVLPTFANVLGPQLFWTGDARFGIDWKKLLHVEQRLMIHLPLQAPGEAIVKSRINGIRDKGAKRGALMFQEKQLRAAPGGAPVASIFMTLLLRGDGGCGDFGTTPEELPELPGRRPDLGIALFAAPILPFIYRLSGDLNPLHVDPGVAVEAGFERPVLHGLCTMGMIGNVLLKHFCSFQPGRLRELSVRFTHPVWPADRLQLECWDEGGGVLRFRVRCRETKALTHDRGLARIQ